MKDLARLGLTLMVICAVAGLGLAVVYDKTKPVIEAQAQQALLKAVQEVIPGAATVEEKVEDGKTYFLGYAGGQLVGAAMKVESRGYGQTPMELIVGFDKEGVVAKVIILSMSETPGIGTRVKDAAYLEKYEGVEDPSSVEGVSGATYSSRAVQSGVASAMEFVQRALGVGSGAVEIVLADIPDGTYEGSGEGLFGPINVSVKIEGGKLISIEITQQSETPGLSDPAIQNVPKSMVEKQSVDVDTVAGATFTSKGIIEAVRNALAGAQ
ncbi:MAG: FMN-binding protein [Bacillota bacterium]|jgi:RnfABCDGE-type electron transport complex G subunit